MKSAGPDGIKQGLLKILGHTMTYNVFIFWLDQWTT